MTTEILKLQVLFLSGFLEVGIIFLSDEKACDSSNLLTTTVADESRDICFKRHSVPSFHIPPPEVE